MCVYINIYIYTYIHIYIHMCMYVCMYVYTYVYVCIYVYIHTHIYIHTYLHIFTYTYMYTYIHTYIHTYIYIYIYVYIHIYMYVCMYVYIHTHIYIHTYLHIFTYKYIYIYIYIHTYLHEIWHPVPPPGQSVAVKNTRTHTNTTMTQAARIQALPRTATPSTALGTPQGVTASLEARELHRGENMMKRASKGMNVDVFWADKNGVEDWWKARICLVRHRKEGKHPAGVQVEFLDDKGQADTTSEKYFISVSALPRKLKFDNASDINTNTPGMNIISHLESGKQPTHVSLFASIKVKILNLLSNEHQ